MACGNTVIVIQPHCLDTSINYITFVCHSLQSPITFEYPSFFAGPSLMMHWLKSAKCDKLNYLLLFFNYQTLTLGNIIATVTVIVTLCCL